ncbi:MAG TPA: class II aldolase/adducin family protein [Methylomirabilota bacterium]|jgi:L-fuculose-phosphate aldolase
MTVLAQQIIGAALGLFHAGLVSETSGNISVRCPDGDRMLITPSGRDCRLLAERDLVLVQLHSGGSEGRLRPSSEWQLHAAIYRARQDVGAVIHHHATWASAIAVARRSIPVLIDEAADLGPVPAVPYAPSGSQALADAAATEFAQGRNAALLVNHGAVVGGRDLHEAFRFASEVERLAKIFIGAELMGGAHPLDEREVRRGREFFAAYRPAAVSEPPWAPGVLAASGGHVRLHDVVSYAFRAGITFASLLESAILRKPHR